MARVNIGMSWTALTTGSNNAVVSPEGRVMLYIGTAAPAANEPGIPFHFEKIQVAPPAQAWIKSGEQTPVLAVQFVY